MLRHPVLATEFQPSTPCKNKARGYTVTASFTRRSRRDGVFLARIATLLLQRVEDSISNVRKTRNRVNMRFFPPARRGRRTGNHPGTRFACAMETAGGGGSRHPGI